MAKVQYSYIQRKKSEGGQSGTVTYDLPESGFMPELIVTAYSTPTASTDPALPLSEAITKIEIVDGSKVLKSLTGNQIKGLMMIHGPKSISGSETNDNAVEGHDEIRLLMGKIINGVNYAPDMSRFSNPQIKITYDYSITTGKRGATYDADAAPAMKFTVLAKIVREGGKYTHGYVKSSEIYTFTQAASTETPVEIPRGEKLIGLGIEAGYDALQFTDDVNQLKLDFDNSDWIPIEFYEDEVISCQKLYFPEGFEYNFMMDIIDAVEIDTHMGYVTHIDGTGLSSGGRSFEYDGSHKGVEAVGYMDVATPTAIATYEQVYISSKGFIPFGMWYLPMSMIQDGADDTLDTTAYSRIVLKMTSSASASTSSTPSIIAEYLVTA